MEPSDSTPKPAMVILNVGAEDSICRDFIPYWEKSGCELIFSSPLDDKSKIEGFRHIHVGSSYNRDDRSTWWKYQSRVLETMRQCLAFENPAFCFTQYDSVCFGKIPLPKPEECVTHVAGGSIDGLGNFFVHPPWMFGRDALSRFVQEADRNPINMCRGVMDFWMAKILELACIPMVDSGGVFVWSLKSPSTVQFSGDKSSVSGWSWTANAIDTAAKLFQARKFYLNGGLFIHGVKNMKTLEAILA